MLRLPEEWRVPVAFALLVIGGLVYSASHAWFWQRAHDMAWIAGPLVLILVGLLLRRSRIAWWVIVSIFAVGVVSDVIHVAGHHVTAAWIAGGIVGLIEFGLLVSPPMRRFMRFEGRLAPSPS
jgi:hypothetical protein